MNPYETLGVPTDATTAQIKRAYRDKAKEAHPDKGGNTDKMAQVNRAWGILSDPEKRKRYDETGTDKEDDLSGRLHAAFADMITKIFFQGTEQNAKRAIQLFSETVDREYNKAKEMIRNKRSMFEKAKARIIKAPEFDLMGGIIAQGLQGVAEAEKQNEQEYEVHMKALELIRAYVFKEPEEVDRTTHSFFTVSDLTDLLNGKR